MIAGIEEVKTRSGRMMDSHDHHITTLDAFEAAIDWWREAGVDYDFEDAPRGWLAERAAAQPPQPKTAPEKPASPPRAIDRAVAPAADQPRIGGERSGWPSDLAAFRQWWRAEPTLAPGVPDRRLAPRGVAGPRLMVLVAQPEPDDGAELLSGEAGKLLAAILRAMGINAEEAYFASALPTPAALPQWEALAEAGLGAVTRHHIALAAPQRVLTFGRGLAPLFGLLPADAREPQMLDVGRASLPLLLAPGLDELARSPARRQRFWQRWLDWTR